MEYEPTNWKSGDIITSAKLNKLENGVAGAGGSVLVVHDVEGTLDATWKQIVDASHANGVAFEKTDASGYTGVYLLAQYGQDAESGHYILTFGNQTGGATYYYSETENGYPVNDD